MSLQETAPLICLFQILPVDRMASLVQGAVEESEVAVAGVVGVEEMDLEVLLEIEHSRTSTRRASPITIERGGMIERWQSLTLAHLDSFAVQSFVKLCNSVREATEHPHHSGNIFLKRGSNVNSTTSFTNFMSVEQREPGQRNKDIFTQLPVRLEVKPLHELDCGFSDNLADYLDKSSW